MAINVNTVYQTVLLILNKEQRGYMTPVEFNKIGAQVQLEIFETYFDSLNQQLRVPQTDTDYADRVVNLDEKLQIFKTTGTASYNNGTFSLPTITGGVSKSDTITSTGATSYIIQNITGSELADGTNIVSVNGVTSASTNYTITGTSLIWNNNTPIAGAVIIITSTPNNFYRLGTVVYTNGNRSQTVERVDRGEFYTMNLSPLTRPSVNFPIYLYENDILTVYPSTIQTGVTVDYIRKPVDPSWNFASSAANNYAYTYDSSTSINFELHPAEQTEVILKTLLYAGVVIEDPTIINVAAQQVQQEQTNQKS